MFLKRARWENPLDQIRLGTFNKDMCGSARFCFLEYISKVALSSKKILSCVKKPLLCL